MRKKLIILLGLAVIIISVIASIVVFVLTRNMKGSGKLVSKTFEIESFDRLTLEGLGEVIITQGEKQSLIVETDDNLMDLVTPEIQEDNLTLKFGDFKITSQKIPSKLVYSLTVKDLDEISINGGGKISSEALNVRNINLLINGAGIIDLFGLEAKNVKTNINGAGKCTLSGKGKNQEVKIEGFGSYDAFEYETEDSTIEINGDGNVKISVSEKLEANIKGAGTIEYKGEAELEESIEGTGKITKVE